MLVRSSQQTLTPSLEGQMSRVDHSHSQYGPVGEAYKPDLTDVINKPFSKYSGCWDQPDETLLNDTLQQAIPQTLDSGGGHIFITEHTEEDSS